MKRLEPPENTIFEILPKPVDAPLSGAHSFFNDDEQRRNALEKTLYLVENFLLHDVRNRQRFFDASSKDKLRGYVRAAQEWIKRPTTSTATFLEDAAVSMWNILQSHERLAESVPLHVGLRFSLRLLSYELNANGFSQEGDRVGRVCRAVSAKSAHNEKNPTPGPKA
jgi:hypothetical protein